MMQCSLSVHIAYQIGIGFDFCINTIADNRNPTVRQIVMLLKMALNIGAQRRDCDRGLCAEPFFCI